MTANELRIGNLIRWKSTGNIERVLTIDVSKGRAEYINNVNISDCEPIPLTEEWLLKFGFKDHEYYWKKKKVKAVWAQRVISTGVRSGISIEKYDHIRYIHQLQNLYFALTGKELTLESES